MLRLLRGAGAAGLGAMAETMTSRAKWRDDCAADAARVGGAKCCATWIRLARVSSATAVMRIGVCCATACVSNCCRRSSATTRRDCAAGSAALASEMRELDDYLARRGADRTEPASSRERRGRPAGPFGFERPSPGCIPALAAAVLREFLTARIWSLRRLSRRHIDDLRRLCQGESPSATIDLPGGWRAERRYAALAIERRVEAQRRSLRASDGPFAVTLARKGVTKVRQAGFVFHSSMMPADASPMPLDLYEACFDADLAAAGLIVRSFAPGDRVSPLGMEGSRKLHDIFIDRKLARPRRQTVPVVTLEGQVAWVPGMVRGRVALVREKTVGVLRLRAFEAAIRV